MRETIQAMAARIVETVFHRRCTQLRARAARSGPSASCGPALQERYRVDAELTLHLLLAPSTR